MSYEEDKQIFVRHYRKKNDSEAHAEAAWRAYFIGRRVEVRGETVRAASSEYNRQEGKKLYEKNPKRKELSGGVPFEQVSEVAVYSTPDSSGFFVGVLLLDKKGRATLELGAAGEDRLFRISESSPFLDPILGARRRQPLGFSELDTVLLAFVSDKAGFRARAETEKGVDFILGSPSALAEKRWGERGERAARRL